MRFEPRSSRAACSAGVSGSSADRGPAPDAPLGLADRLGAGEDPGHRVVVALGDRVELVVVAPRTADASAPGTPCRPCRPADRPRRCAAWPCRPRRPCRSPSNEEAGGDQVARPAPRRVPEGSKSPASCSRMNRSNGLSALNAVDDVIAIPPGVLGEDVVGRADLVGVARQVQPVPGPALAERRRRQQPIDDALLGPGRRGRSTNATISSGEGGRPVRSSVTRRSQV